MIHKVLMSSRLMTVRLKQQHLKRSRARGSLQEVQCSLLWQPTFHSGSSLRRRIVRIESHMISHATWSLFVFVHSAAM